MSYHNEYKNKFAENIENHIKLLDMEHHCGKIPPICNSASIFVIKGKIFESWVKKRFTKLSFSEPVSIDSGYVLDMPILNIKQHSLDSYRYFNIFTNKDTGKISNRIYYTCCWYERYNGYLPWKNGFYFKPIMYQLIMIPLNLARYYIISIFSTYSLSYEKCIQYFDKNDIIKINNFYADEANKYFGSTYLGGYEQSHNYKLYTNET